VEITPKKNIMAIEATKQSTEKKSKKTLFYIILIVVLGLLNGGMFFWNWQTTQENNKLEANVDSLEKTKIELNAKLDEAQAELEAMKGTNEELDAKVDSLLAQIEDQRKTIGGLNYRVRQIKVTRDGLERALDNLNAQIAELKASYEAKIDTLNQKLTAEIDDKNRIIDIKTGLEEIIARGSALKAISFNTKAIQVKGSGKEKETTKAKKVSKLTLDFEIAENLVADAGSKEIIFVITGPDGATLASDAKGSGMFIPEGESTEERYSMKKTISYNNKSTPMSITWDDEAIIFSPGTYKFELYESNKSIGRSSIELF